MTPIRVPCTSCGGKLVIRSEKLLGQLVSCPRCKHMVAVPALSQDGDSAPIPSVDSQAMTSIDLNPAGLDAPASELPNSPQLGEPVSSQLSQAITREFNDDMTDELSSGLPHFSSRRTSFDDDIEETLSSPIPFDSSTPQPDVGAPNEWQTPSPVEDWQSAAAKKRQVMLLATVAAFVCLGSILLLGFFLSSVADKGEKLAQDSSLPDPQARTPGSGDAPLLPEPAESPKADDTEVATASVVAESPDSAPGESSDDSDPGTGSTPGNVTAAESMTEPTPAEIPDSVANGSTDIVAEAPVDPLAEFLRNATPELKYDSNEVPKSDTSNNAAVTYEGIPEGLLKNAPIFELSNSSNLPDTDLLNPNDIDGGNAVAEQVEIGIYYHPDAAPVPVWDDIRQKVIPSLSIHDKTLPEVLSTLESVFGIGFGWDIQAMINTPIDLSKTFSIDVKQESVEAIMTQLLEPYRLQLKSTPNALPTITPVASAMEVELPESIPLAAWLTEQATANAWLQFFQRAIPQYADRFVLEDQAIRLPIDMSITDRQRLWGLLSQITQIKSQEEKRLRRTDQLELIASVDKSLNTLGKSFSAQRRSVPVVLQRTANEYSFPLLIDWSKCWEHGLTPFVTTNVLTNKRTFEQVASYSLDQFALVIIADPFGRLVLTTPPAQRELSTWLVIPVADDVTVDVVRTSLAMLTPVGEGGRSSLRVIPLPDFDSPGRWYFVNISPPTIKQFRNKNLRSVLQLDKTD